MTVLYPNTPHNHLYTLYAIFGMFACMHSVGRLECAPTEVRLRSTYLLANILSIYSMCACMCMCIYMYKSTLALIHISSIDYGH